MSEKDQNVPQEIIAEDIVQITTETTNYKSNYSSVFNLVNSITASGILSIPYALSVAGFIPGMIMIILVWYLSNFNFENLTMISSETQTHSFKSIVYIFYGKRMSNVSELSILLYTLSNIIARFVILGQFIIRIFEYGISIQQVPLWFIKTGLFFVVLPMCLMTDLKSLKFASYLSLICIPISLFIVVYRLLSHESFYNHLNNIALFNFTPQMFMAFGLIVVSFCGHFNLPKIYQELEDRNPKKMNFIIRISTTACFLTYVIIGISGYVTFEDTTVGNVINNYETNDLLALITRLCLTSSLLFSTPFVCSSCRRSLNSLLFPREKKLSSIEWFLITSMIMFFSLLVSIFIQRSEFIFSIIGGTIGVFLMFVLPGLFLFKNIHSKQVLLNNQIRSFSFIPSKTGYFLISSGILLGFLCTISTIRAMIYNI